MNELMSNASESRVETREFRQWLIASDEARQDLRERRYEQDLRRWEMEQDERRKDREAAESRSMIYASTLLRAFNGGVNNNDGSSNGSLGKPVTFLYQPLGSFSYVTTLKTTSELLR